jgi:nucleoside-diphosphate-sugar epimerase
LERVVREDSVRNGFADIAGPVLVAGANGGVGRHVMTRLRAYGVSARAMARSSEKLAPFVAAGDDAVIADVRDPESLRRATAGAAAVVCCVGARVGFSAPGSSVRDFFGFGPDGPEAVDNLGTKNLVAAMKSESVNRLVIVTSTLIHQPLNPFNFLMKPFGDILTQKDRAERCVRESGLAYTIVRPGGLTNAPPFQRGVRIAPADALSAGEISRADVAEVCVQALWCETALNKTIEIINNGASPVTDWTSFFAVVN